MRPDYYDLKAGPLLLVPQLTIEKTRADPFQRIDGDHPHKQFSYNVPIWLEESEGVAQCRYSIRSGSPLLQRW